MSPVSGKNSRRFLVQAFRLNTALNRQRISNESSCGALARDPHQYPTYAGSQVLRGNFQLNIVSSFVGAWGAVSCVDIRFTASLCTLSPLLPSCFWHSSDPGRVQSAVAPTCTPAMKKQLWPGTTSLVQLKEKERPAQTSPLYLLSLRVQLQGICTTGEHFFMIKMCKSCPPLPKLLWLGHVTRS